MAARAPQRPFIFVLAGVNGAGKSSVGGSILRAQGLAWFNPDSFARELMARSGASRDTADGDAWAYGKAQLEAAIATGTSFAFETTLGGTTIARLLAAAARTHDVMMIFCGLASLELHLARVQLRVRAGGHDIPKAKIRERWDSSRQNLIALLPRLAHLQVFDNSAEAAPGADVPFPLLVLEMKDGRVLYPRPDDVAALQATPDWSKPIVAAAFRCEDAKVVLRDGAPARGASKERR
jgi:predicted ABC-type ATPase